MMSARMIRCGLKILPNFSKKNCILHPKTVLKDERHFSQKKGRKNFKNEAEKFVLPQHNTLDELRLIRRNQASASVLIQLASDDIASVYEKCVKYGPVKVVLNYRRNDKNLLLIEYENPGSVHDLMQESQHFRNNQHIPVETPFLYYPRLDNGKFRRKNGERVMLDHNVLFREIPKRQDALETSLVRADSMSVQMVALYQNLQMSDINTRERFMICHLVEGILNRVFTNCQVYPFGSSFSGFGRHDCDLDMVCDLERDSLPKGKKGNGLFFLSKLRSDDIRQDQQNNLAIVADMMQFVMPQVFHVKRILRAFVPIVRFTHLTGMQCDISMENRSAFYMTELLHLYGQVDERVRPLVFSIRHWAKDVELTGHPGGLCISNFMLTVMTIFYLQQGYQPVLPSIESLKGLAGPTDRKTINDEDCSFVSDWSKVRPSQNKTNLEDLFVGFLTFYEKFDFTSYGINVISGKSTDKPPDTPMYIVNPIEKQLNVCKNITEDEIANFQQKCRSSQEILEANRTRNNKSWGLLAFQKPQEDNMMISMNISDILKDNTESSNSSDESSSAERDGSKTANENVSDQILSQTNAKSS